MDMDGWMDRYRMNGIKIVGPDPHFFNVTIILLTRKMAFWILQHCCSFGQKMLKWHFAGHFSGSFYICRDLWGSSVITRTD